jgi:hypothetical protein
VAFPAKTPIPSTVKANRPEKTKAPQDRNLAGLFFEANATALSA